MFKKKILVIEETKFMRNLISNILESAGYKVICAKSGYEGLSKTISERPDLVIIDVLMTDIGGLEICKILRKDTYNNFMPIILLTSQDNEEDRLKGLELGADDYIITPFNPRELLSRIKNILRRTDQNRNANPLTGLSGNIDIQMEMNSRIDDGELFAVLYIDLDNFKAYNDVYGFVSGDKVIKLTADIIQDNVSLFGDDKTFTGHIGGDDFLVITHPKTVDKMSEGIIKDFDKKILKFYNSRDVEKEYITTTDRFGKCVEFPIMRISIAVVSNEYYALSSTLQISVIAAELKGKAKKLGKSVVIKDIRKS